MNFDLTEEQQMLADTTRDVLSGYDTEKRNKVIESDEGFSREVWQQLASSDWVSMRTPALSR